MRTVMLLSTTLICASVCVYVCVPACVFVCIYARLGVRMYVGGCVCVCVIFRCALGIINESARKFPPSHQINFKVSASVLFHCEAFHLYTINEPSIGIKTYTEQNLNGR